MIKKQLTIQHEDGIDAKQASIFVKEAMKFHSSVSLHLENSEVNGKSIIGLLTLALNTGTEFILAIDGPDEKLALSVLAPIIVGE